MKKRLYNETVKSLKSGEEGLLQKKPVTQTRRAVVRRAPAPPRVASVYSNAREQRPASGIVGLNEAPDPFA